MYGLGVSMGGKSVRSEHGGKSCVWVRSEHGR